MSLERKPAGRSGAENTPSTRTLAVSSNPAQRLQELLRREAEQAHEELPTPDAPEVIEPAEPMLLPETVVAVPVAPSVPPAPTLAAAAPPSIDTSLGRREEPVLLIVVVNSERNGPVEYASIEEMPTIVSLEETHRAFLLSDEWQRRGPILTRVVRLRRRRR